MLTLIEVCDKLKGEDEVILLEILNLTSEDIVERCIDIIEEQYEQLAEELGQDDDGFISTDNT